MYLRLLFALFSLVAAALAYGRGDWRDRDDDARRGGPRVILYEHADFRGDTIVLYPGDAIDNFSGRMFDNGAKLNDRVSSIRVEGNVEVFLYENSRFRGEALRVTENARDLTGRPVSGSAGQNWNDRISSIRVERVRGRDGDRDPDRSARPPARPPANPEKAIKDAFRDLLDRDPDAGELRDFRGRLIDGGWTERMLRDHLRSEERYRNEAAERIVRRAYREVLGRDADPSGLRQYTWAVRDKGWSESDVRDDLRKSVEYRNKPRP